MPVTTYVKVTCGGCGRENRATQPDLAVVAYDPPEGSFCQYTCAGCGERRVRALEPSDLEKLENGGVRILRVGVERLPGPRVSLDDAIDLHLELEAWGE